MEDERLEKIEDERALAKTETEKQYNEMISQSDNYYQKQIDAQKEWADKQSNLQQQQSDLAIEQINQQKEKEKKNYETEQRGAYGDYQRAGNQFSIQAEKMAEAGLANTGVSETAKINMFNTYQNRYVQARETYKNAELNYSNSIKEAQLSNNATLAEIAYNSLQTQLQLSLQGFQYRNDLLEARKTQIANVENRYDTKYNNMVSEMQWEKEFRQRLEETKKDQEYRWAQLNQQKLEGARDYQLALRQLEQTERQVAQNSKAYNSYELNNNGNETELSKNAQIFLNAHRDYINKNGNVSAPLIAKAIEENMRLGRITEEDGHDILDALGL